MGFDLTSHSSALVTVYVLYIKYKHCTHARKNMHTNKHSCRCACVPTHTHTHTHTHTQIHIHTHTKLLIPYIYETHSIGCRALAKYYT